MVETTAALGGTALGQVLRRYSVIFGDWRFRRMYALYIESLLSYLWAVTFVLVSAFWVFSYSIGASAASGSPIPNFLGHDDFFRFVLVQARLRDMDGFQVRQKHHWRTFRKRSLYPTFYWFLLTTSTFVYTTGGLVKPLDLLAPTRWNIEHSYGKQT
jgi:biofilm PGA synthesis N-glycosyltransferase PgaC